MSALEIGFKHLTNASKTARGLIEATVEAKLQAAIIDVQNDIIAAQQSNMSAQAEHAALLDKIRALEAEIVGMKNWSTEAARYEAKVVSDHGVIVYKLKEDEASAEAKHELCPHCFTNGKKSIMQPTPEIAPRVRLRLHKCPSCSLELAYSSGRGPDNTDRTEPVVRRDPPPVGSRRRF